MLHHASLQQSSQVQPRHLSPGRLQSPSGLSPRSINILALFAAIACLLFSLRGNKWQSGEGFPDPWSADRHRGTSGQSRTPISHFHTSDRNLGLICPAEYKGSQEPPPTSSCCKEVSVSVFPVAFGWFQLEVSATSEIAFH